MNKIILKTNVYATIRGRRLTHDYRMIIKRSSHNNKWLIGPEQSFKGKYNKYSGLPCWYLDSIDNSSDCFSLAIDYGQGWYIHNVNEAIQEALTLINNKG